MIGRNTKLHQLMQYYQQEGSQIFVLYGRKEHGIREMVREFCKDKPSFYYHAPETSALAQRQRMGREIASAFQAGEPEGSYEALFQNAASQDGGKLVVVIDEFQNILKKDMEFWDAIVKRREGQLCPEPMFLLLCSTSIPWIEQEMPKALGAAGKKPDRVAKCGELRFLDLVRQFPDYTLRESVEVFGVIGGVPEYMRQWEKGRDIRANICTHILSEDGFLYHKAWEILRSHLREPAVYQAILEVMASGKRKLNDLYQATGFSRAKISVYIKNLMEFDVVEKVCSFETGGWQNAQKGLYQIADTFLNFWFRFVYPYLSDLFRLSPEEFYDCHIARELEGYLKRYFIKVCMEYLQLQDMVGRLPLHIHKMGSWIGKKGNIDIIVQNSVRENLICLCNWSEAEMTFEMCQQMFESMEQVKIGANFYYLFTAKGFEDSLVKMAAEDERILLVDMGNG